MKHKYVFLKAILIILIVSTQIRAQSWDSVGPGMGHFVFGLLSDNSNNKLYIAGAFANAGPATIYRVAQWDGSTMMSMNTGMNDLAYAFSMYNSELYCAGKFTTAGSNSCNYIARWDGTDWFPLGSGMDNEVYYLTTYNGELIAGGIFTTAGLLPASRIARWNGVAWIALGTGLSGGAFPYVLSMLDFGGELYVAGQFTDAGGVTVSNIAKWNGTTWSDVGGGSAGGGGYISDLFVYNGELYACGSFTSIGGVTASGIAKWNGTAWSSAGTGFAGAGAYGNVLFTYRNELYAGGNFTSVDGVAAENIARYDGSTWKPLGSGCDDEVYALEVYNDELIAGGAFVNAGGDPHLRIAKWIMPCALSVTLTSQNVSCAGACDGSATASPSGIPPFAYVWSTGDTTGSIANLCAGIYSVSVTDSAGCIVIDSIAVTENPLPSITISSNDPSCMTLCNGMAVASVSGIPPFTYNWNTAPPQNTDTAFALCAGTYTVTVTDSAGCTSVDSVTVSDPVYSLSFASSDPTCNQLCDGLSSVSYSSPNGPHTYSWNTSPVQTTQTATGLCAGIYSVMVTDSTGCAMEDSVIISDPNYALSFSSTQVTCAQVCDAQATVNTTSPFGPYSYFWDTTPQQTTQTATGLCEGTILVSVTDSNGCVIQDSVLITSPPQFALSFAFVSETCPGACDALASVSSASPFPPYSYFWSTVPQQNTDTASGLCTGTYSVTVIDSLGCFSTDSVAVDPSSLVLSLNIVPESCTGGGCDGSASASFNGIPPFTYLWSTGDTTDTVLNLCAGFYTITVTDSSGCSVSGIANVTPALPPAITLNATPVLCAGQCTGEITASVSGNGPFSFVWSSGDSTATISGLCPGMYVVTVTDNDGCVSADSVVLFPPNPVDMNILSISHVTCNGLCDGSVSITGTGGTSPYTYLWSNSSSDPDLFNLCGGPYTVTITDSNSCSYTSSPIVINEPAALALTMTPTDATCQGCNDGSISVSISGGTAPYTYFWTPPVPNPNQLSAGWYYLCITDNNSCQICDSAYVDEPTGISQLNENTYYVQVFPNPFSDKTKIILPLEMTDAPLSFTVSDVAGKIISESVIPVRKSGSYQYILYEKGVLVSGMYFFRISNSKNQTTSGKLLVE